MAALDDIFKKLNAEEQQDLQINKMNEVQGNSPEQRVLSPSKQPQTVQTTVDEDIKPITTYQDAYKYLNPQPSEKELEEERKRQRRNAVIAAIGDGISAIANMHYAGKGAPSSYDPRLSLSAKLQERYDKLNAERRAHDKEWRAGYARAQALDRQAESDRNKWELTRRRLDAQYEKWRQEQEAKAAAQQKKAEQTDFALAIKQQEADRKDKEQKAKEEGRGGYARGGGRGGSRKPQYDSTVKTTKYVDEKGRPVTVRDTKYTPSGSSSRSGGNTSNKDYSGYKVNQNPKEKWAKNRKNK